jgi:hypothetical protein
MMDGSLLFSTTYIDAWFYGEPPQNLGQKTAISQSLQAKKGRD